MRIKACFNKECPNFCVKEMDDGLRVECGGHGNNCLVHEDIFQCESYVEVLIQCKHCGLPAELCECPNAEVGYDFERDVFFEKRPPKENNEDGQNNLQQPQP